MSSPRSAALAWLSLSLLLAAQALAWPPAVAQAIARDARRLLPRSLASALAAREDGVRAHIDALFAAAPGVNGGRLSPQTLALVDGEADGVLELLRTQHVGDGLVRLGGLARLPLEVSDPASGVDETALPGRVRDEYYLFVQANLSKIPVVLSDPGALELSRADLAAYWQRLLEESRAHTDILRAEMLRNGRVVGHQSIDFRSPVFGVASLSYSRAVTGVAATWLAVWREAQGDLTRRAKPVEITPRAPPPAAVVAPTPTPGPAAAQVAAPVATPGLAAAPVVAPTSNPAAEGRPNPEGTRP
jgi:hypothetical protein